MHDCEYSQSYIPNTQYYWVLTLIHTQYSIVLLNSIDTNWVCMTMRIEYAWLYWVRITVWLCGWMSHVAYEWAMSQSCILNTLPQSSTRIRDMTHSHVCHDSFICAPWLSHPHAFALYQHHSHLLHMCPVTHSYVWHDAFICAPWLIHMCDMTRIHTASTPQSPHSYIVASFICMYDCVTVTYFIHIQPIADRVAQHLEIISKNFRFSTRRTRILMGLIIYYLVLIVNPIGRILVRWNAF